MMLYNRYFILLFLYFYSVCIFAQSDELCKISKYVVAKKDASCLYKDPNFESLILKECPMPEPEEGDSGDGIAASLCWERADKRQSESVIVKASVLPVISETESWYQVFYTSPEEWLDQQSVTAYVPKSDYTVSHLLAISEQKLRNLAKMNTSIRNEGRYKDYCVMWGNSEILYGTVFYIGRIIDNVVFFSNCKYYVVDEEKQMIKLYEEYEVGAPTIDFGKDYLDKGDHCCDANFRKLTDNDIDKMMHLFSNQYDKAYVNVEGAEDMCIINLAALKEVNPIITEESPEFIGGEEALTRWLYQNVKYPKQAKDNYITGRVVVSFVVDIDGSIKDVKVVRPVDPALDKEAIRVVKSMPKWKPGKRNGEPVPVRYTTPVIFRIN